jgi:hypothetical protein
MFTRVAETVNRGILATPDAAHRLRILYSSQKRT